MDELANMIREIYRRSIGGVAPVKDEPEIILRQWRVYAVADRLHFVGWSEMGAEGRVSSAIRQFDPEARRGETRSGRIYKLIGPPGHSSEAEFVFGVWLDRQDLKRENAVAVPLEAIGNI